jgi:hypothetical protein
MTYHDRLHPWCIARLQFNMQHRIVVRFRRRNDAEAHLKVLRYMNPGVTYAIIFDVTLDSAEPKMDDCKLNWIPE